MQKKKSGSMVANGINFPEVKDKVSLNIEKII